MKVMNLAELNQLYDDSETLDRELFSEMRSNVLLIAGEHYTKNVNKQFSRLRETNRLTEKNKLRLTKNHIHRAHRIYVDQILQKAPGVAITPNNDSEMQDQKDAELNKAVWKNICRRHKMTSKIRDWADEFVGIGEVAAKIFWDPNAGDFVGYNQAVDEMGQPQFDEMGQPAADKDNPQFSGDFVFEPLYGFNLLRAAGTKQMEDSPFLGIRKMVPHEDLAKMYHKDPEKLKFIEESSKRDYIIFDSSKAQYEHSSKHVLVKEFYYKPCKIYPEGYFYIFTDYGILDHGVLPFGIYPIKWKAFDKYPTTPRGRSIIKVARPYQAEVNRAASQRATHQITTGDDKILYQSGTKLAPGALLPGVRGISFQGMSPTILPGRTGEQFGSYIGEEIADMERAIMLGDVSQEEAMNLDPYSLLFRSMSQQAKYKKYIDKFSEFIVEVCELTLELAKQYLPEDQLIQMIGRNEQVNIAEFKSTNKLRFEIKVEPMSDSLDTMLGKQLTFNHLLQYVGKNLDKEDIGKIIKNMPFVNNEESFSDLTIEYDNVKNDMLAMERGEMPEVTPYADSEYYIKKLTHRMKQSDFRFLAPEVQQNYQTLYQQHLQEQARKMEAIQNAKKETIPVQGAMIAADMYVPNQDPEKAPKRVRVPYQALEWLVQQLEKQNMSLEKLEEMNQGALAELAGQMVSSSQTPMPVGNPGQPIM